MTEHTRNKRKHESYVTSTKDIAATVVSVGDKRSIRFSSLSWLQYQLGKFKLDEKVTVYLSSKRPKRSEAQNSYYWGVYLPLIMKETGEDDIEALHNLFKGKFLTTEVKEVLGEKVRVTKSTTELTKAEFGEYIEHIAALTNVAPPDTTGYYD